MQKMDKPNGKISQIFIDFVKPVMPEVDENTTEHQIKTFFEIGLMVWNAVLLDSVDPDNNNNNMDWIEDLLSKEPGYKLFIEPLIERRKTVFANDKRMIEDFTLTYENGDLEVRAKAGPMPKPGRKE